MRRYLVLLALVSTILTAAHSQTQINPVIGINFSSLTNEPEGFNSEARFGWHFGVNLREGDRFYLQPGIHFAQLNSDLTVAEDGQSITDSSFKSNIGVLRIPLLAGLRLFSNEKKDAPVNINVHAGIATEFVLSVDEKNTGLIKEDFNSPIFAAVIGVGVDILFLTLDLDYEIGLSPVFDNSNSDRLRDITTDPKNTAFVISIGGKFQL